MGAFASIYHPVGIPMIVQHSTRPGFTIGLNGLAGNLGIAFAAILTGFLVQQAGWRVAFAVPSLLSIACGITFALVVPREETAPAKKPRRQVDLPPALMARIFLVMSLAAVSSSMIFNFTTNGNNQLLAERLRGLVDNPATLGVLLAVVYAIASLAQIVVGKLIDRYPLKYVYLPIVAVQVPLFALAAHSEGWALYALMLLFMVVVFGAIPFVDAMIVQYVDDRMRSRVAGMRLAVSFGVSALAVYLLGPTVKAAGFTTLLLVMAGISTLTTLFVSLLPGRIPSPRPPPRPRRRASGPRTSVMPDPAFSPGAHRLAEPRWFEDLQVGERFLNPSRTMTEALFAAFQLASADNHPIHYDREYCHAHGHRDLLAHGLLVAAQAAAGAGMFPHGIGESLIAFLEQSSRFLKPVYVGDTVYPALTITALEPGRTTGVVVMRATVHNQAGDLVMEGEHRYLLRRKRPA